MSDYVDLNEILDDLNGISVEIMDTRKNLNAATLDLKGGKEPAAHDAYRKLSEALMLVDDVMAIMASDLGAEFVEEEYDF